jgi:S-formylglutathione hydrolase
MLSHRTFRILVVVCAIQALNPAQSNAQSGGITHVDSIPAPSLRNNLLGDADIRAATVYLPPSYSKSRSKRYPVVYLLHGFGADHRAFMKGSYQDLNVRISMDSLIKAGLSREMIVVTPNARNFFDGSFYSNSVTTGNWEDFIVRDLVTYMDRHYRTIRSPSGRGIAGHSMGGYGALRVGMNHPEIFSAIYALSPCCLGDYTVAGAGSARDWKIDAALTDRSQYAKAGFLANLLFAQAGVYSPDPSKPPFFADLPYRIEGDSLVLVPEVAAKWAQNPMSMFAAHAAQLKRMKIAFDAGRADGFKDIPANVQKLDSLLTSMGVAHTAELYDGNHGDKFRVRLESKAFPFFSQVLH